MVVLYEKLGGARTAKGGGVVDKFHGNVITTSCSLSASSEDITFRPSLAATMSRKDLEALGSQRESLSTNPLLIQVS